jgi:hypothetical protein
MSENKFIRFKNDGVIWVTESNGAIIEEEVKSSNVYHGAVLPHVSPEYCHILFSDDSIARDVKREWFEIVEDLC